MNANITDYYTRKHWVAIAATSVLAIGIGGTNAANASLTPKPEGQPSRGGTLISLEFIPPNDEAPAETAGGGTRGARMRFQPPAEEAPRNTAGGGTRRDITFKPPGEEAPTNTIGGGTRGDVTFKPPGGDTPENTVSGGTRRDELPSPIAVLPESNIGRTAIARPTFFVYLPPSATNRVFFSLQTASGETVYQTTRELSDAVGIVSFTLPEDAPALEIGENYQWFFAPLQAGEMLGPDSYRISGWVKRVEPPRTTGDISALAPAELAKLYAESGIWYDTLAVLVSELQGQPNPSLEADLADLLAQVGLEAIATAPVGPQL